jgi:putative transcriptional regulator
MRTYVLDAGIINVDRKRLFMIKIKIAEMLGKHKMTRKKLAELIKVRPNTIGDLYNESIRRLDLQTLDKICELFDCKIEDIIEYVSEEE